VLFATSEFHFVHISHVSTCTDIHDIPAEYHRI